MRLCQKRYRHQIIEGPTQYFGPETVLPPSPNPMPLTVTESKIEKAWSVERNPGTMAQLLYDEEGHPEIKDVVNIGVTLDERIADGFYFARSLKLLNYYLRHPEILERPVKEEVDYEY